MRNHDWYYRDDDEDFGEALHRRTEELYNIPDTVPDEDGVIECPVLPLRDLVVFPRMVSPIFVGRTSSLLAIEDAQLADQTVIALTQRNPEIDDPGPEDFLPIGVEMAVGRLLNMPDGSSSALVQGRRRIQLLEITQLEPFMRARARIMQESLKIDRQVDATMRTALELFQKCVNLDRSLPEEAYLYALNIDEPGWLGDMIVTTIAPPFEERQQMLETLDPLVRLHLVINMLAREADVLELEDEIHSKAQSEVDRTQREFYLREQMKAIQTELGEGDVGHSEFARKGGFIRSTAPPDP